MKMPWRFDLIRAELPGFNADIIALQETFDSLTKKLAKTNGYNYYAFGNFAGFPYIVDSGLLTLSKHPIIKTDRITFRDCSGADCFARKGVLFTRIQHPQLGTIDIYNTHLNAGSNNDYIRAKQVLQIHAFIYKNSQSGNPIFVAGDFNFRPDSQLHTYLENKASLKDGHIEWIHNSDELSQEQIDGFTVDRVKNGQKVQKRIDYIWFREGYRFEIQATRSGIVFKNSSSGGRLSDHLSVLTEFTLR